MFKWINKAFVFTITLSGIFIYSENLINIVQPYFISGWIGYLQLFTYGFFIGYAGGMVVDNVIKKIFYV
jgi:Na+/melibiose symporter-like transporter